MVEFESRPFARGSLDLGCAYVILPQLGMQTAASISTIRIRNAATLLIFFVSADLEIKSATKSGRARSQGAAAGAAGAAAGAAAADAVAAAVAA